MARAPHGWFARVCLIAVVVVMLANPVEVCAEDNWDSEPMTLTVLTATVLEPGTKDIEQEIAREFMKLHPNIKVEIQGVPAPEQHTKIVTLGTVGQLPDVFQDQPEWIPSNVEAGFVVDLNRFADKAFFDQYIEESLELCSYKGKIYALQVGMVNMGLLYRKDHFEELGLQEPKTWEEFLAVAKALTRDTDGDGKPDRWGLGMIGKSDRNCWRQFCDMAFNWGFNYIVPSGNGWRSAAGSPEGVAAMKYYAELYNTHKVVPPGSLENGYMETVRDLAMGQVSILFSGSHSIGNAVGISPDIREKLASAPFPKHDRVASRFFGAAWSINANIDEKKQRVAFEFIKFLTNTDNQVKWSRESDWVPTIKAALDAPHLQAPVFEGFVRAADNLYIPPVTTVQAKIEEHGIEAVQKALLKQEPYEKIMETLEKQINSVLQEAGLYHE
jgi:multiple sugar transport system substrate-binding protein